MINTIETYPLNNLKSVGNTKVNFENSRQMLRSQIADLNQTIYRPGLRKEFSRNRLLSTLNNDCFERIIPHLQMTRLDAGKELYAAEEINDYVYFPEDSVISNLHNSEDGHTLETAMIGCEGASGLNSVIGANLSRHQAVVTLGGNARRIKTAIFRNEYLRGGKLQTVLVNYFALQVTAVSQKAICTSFHPMEKRFCSWLLMLHDRVQTDLLTLTHDRIALFLGVNRPGISVIAKNLRDENLIDYKRGKFYIRNRKGLEHAACECYYLSLC